MGVAVLGDPAVSVRVRLGDATDVFAVASGFGAIDGEPAARATLKRLRGECERRGRAERFHRTLRRQQSAIGSLLAIVAHVNAELFARSASHDDYVTAGSSLTIVLRHRRRAYVAHAGGTAAYLSRAGYVVALTQDDAIEDGRILSRSIGTQSQIDASVCTFTFVDGDVLALCTRRLRDEDGRRRLATRLLDTAAGSAGDECASIVRFSADDAAEVPVARAAVAWPRAGTLVAAALFWVLAVWWIG
ncbi:MAG TPA: hypothetical protein VIJ12_06155 [Candidatus Baltobacteraceae bacterium]